jgi:hypothetical protein
MLGVTVAMLVFIVSLFLDWIDGLSGHEGRSWWIALALAIIGGGIFAADALNYPVPTRFATLGVATLAASLAFAWTVFRVVDLTEAPGNLDIGAWVALVSTIVGVMLAAGVWSRERR